MRQVTLGGLHNSLVILRLKLLIKPYKPEVEIENWVFIKKNVYLIIYLANGDV